jgi:hypothetical protein
MAGPRAPSATGARTRCRQALSGWTRRCSVEPSTNLESKHMRSACLRQRRAGTLGTRGARRDHPPPVQRTPKCWARSILAGDFGNGFGMHRASSVSPLRLAQFNFPNRWAIHGCRNSSPLFGRRLG